MSGPRLDATKGICRTGLLTKPGLNGIVLCSKDVVIKKTNVPSIDCGIPLGGRIYESQDLFIQCESTSSGVYPSAQSRTWVV